MEVWYKIRYGTIYELEAVKTTSCFLFGKNGGRTRKISDWGRWFPSRDIAVKDYRDQLLAKIEHAQKELADFDHKFPPLKPQVRH